MNSNSRRALCSTSICGGLGACDLNVPHEANNGIIRIIARRRMAFASITEWEGLSRVEGRCVSLCQGGGGCDRPDRSAIVEKSVFENHFLLDILNFNH